MHSPEGLPLTKEWACPTQKDGFDNKYTHNTEGLSLLYLSGGRYHILNWLALLLKTALLICLQQIHFEGYEAASYQEYHMKRISGE